jgi:hypothetical protein
LVKVCALRGDDGQKEREACGDGKHVGVSLLAEVRKDGGACV